MFEALANVEDAFGAVVEIYQDRGRPLPSCLYVEDKNCPLSVETIRLRPVRYREAARKLANLECYGIPRRGVALTGDSSIQERKRRLCGPIGAAGTCGWAIREEHLLLIHGGARRTA